MRPVWTFARAGIASFLAVALAAVAHGAGGGMAPAFWVAAAAVGALVPFAFLLLRRERSLTVVVAALTVAEMAVHAGFTLSMSRTHSLSAALLLCTHGPASATHATAGAGASLMVVSHVPAAWHLDGAAMTTAHLGATLLLALWIRVGEQACYGFARARVTRWLPPRRRALPVVARVLLDGARRWVPVVVRLPCPVGTRGPPRRPALIRCPVS